MELPKQLIKDHLTIVLVLAAILILGGGFFVFQKFSSQTETPVEEIDLSFDPLGPYALLFPRRDGNALVLNIKRTASYDQIKYELTYNSEGIDRGAAGEINTKEKKGEYEQEILFGSCSTGGKCVFDKDVENGTLTLHIRKGKDAYRVIVQWHLQKPDIALGVLTSGDNHFKFTIDPKSADLTLTKFSISNDLSGAPKLPEGKEILGKVYSINSPVSKGLPEGMVTIEVAENLPAEAKIARFDDKKNNWDLADTKIDGSVASAKVGSGGIFTILVPVKK